MTVPKWQVDLWDAINRYTIACGGDPSKHVYGNTTRQRAVVDVSQAVRDAVEHDRQQTETREVEQAERRRLRKRNAEASGVKCDPPEACETHGRCWTHSR